MYAQQSLQDSLFLMLYGGVAMLAVVAGLYLWIGRSNAILPDITPPRARRPFTVFKLAHECGYRSYLGFYTAFRQRMGTSVMAWTRSEDLEPLDRSISGCLLP